MLDKTSVLDVLGIQLLYFSCRSDDVYITFYLLDVRILEKSFILESKKL